MFKWFHDEAIEHPFRLIIGILAIAAIAMAIVALVVKQQMVATVSAFHWERKIDIQRYETHHDDSWYVPPADAYNVNRSWRYREQTCTSTGSERKCRDKYDWHYDYDIDQWGYAYSLSNVGDQRENIVWPEKVPTACPTIKIGCERESGRSEVYSLILLSDSQEKFVCAFPQADWMTYRVGDRYRFQVGQFTHWPDCNTLTRDD